MAPISNHSALSPAGVQAAEIAGLFHAYLDVSLVVFALVVAALGFALTCLADPTTEKTEPFLRATQGKRRAVLWATIATVVTLIGLLIGSVATGHAMASLDANKPVVVEVIGRKWWWEFRYPSAGPATRFSTAYELHLPIGRPVELKLMASDVIHSFWLPSIAGKLDAIPGKDRALRLRIDQPGIYEGQCAEFCGLQHANMRFVVIAESPTDFAAWRAHQLGSPPPPSDPIAQRGLTVFLNSRCDSCHAISGTTAFGTVGPNLTHLASRRKLAMGTLPNDDAHLRDWISDPAHSKPGVPMPATPLSQPDLQALAAYLRGLQ